MAIERPGEDKMVSREDGVTKRKRRQDKRRDHLTREEQERVDAEVRRQRRHQGVWAKRYRLLTPKELGRRRTDQELMDLDEAWERF